MNDLLCSPVSLMLEWVTWILHRTGAVRDGFATKVVAVKKIKGEFSSVWLLRVEWSSDADSQAPRTLCLKMANPLAGPMTDREVRFYRDVRPLMPDAPLVPCYDAQYYPSSGGYHVLLADVSPTHRRPAFGIPPTEAEAAVMVDALATFHAFWWDDARLGEHVGTKPTEYDIRRMVGYAASHFPRFADMLGDRLSRESRVLLETVFDRFVDVWKSRFAEGRNLTLVHGDAHPRNFLISQSPQIGPAAYVIDWQRPEWVWGVSTGVSDLAPWITRIWSKERRQFLEQPLLRKYHERIQERGVTGYSWADLWRDYRLAALLGPCLIVHDAFRASPNFWYPELENALAALGGLECRELL